MEWQRLLTKNAALIDAQAIQIGLEREGQRVTSTGRLAETALSPTLISKLPGLQRDFAETQLGVSHSATSGFAGRFTGIDTAHTTSSARLKP